MATDLARRKVIMGLGIVALAGGYLTWDRLARPTTPDDARLSVADALEQVRTGEILLIDIRRPDEWARTGIPEGAHPLDMRRRDFTQALERIAKGDTSRPIALICARGVRSARMVRRLDSAGFTHVLDVPEGMLGSASGAGWLARNLPVTPYRPAT